MRILQHKRGNIFQRDNASIYICPKYKIYLSKIQNIFVKNTNFICPKYKIYLSNMRILQHKSGNIFQRDNASIYICPNTKYICPKYKIYLSKIPILFVQNTKYICPK